MRGQPLRLTDFSGGTNLRDDIIDLPPNQSRDLLNVVRSGYGGGIIMRPGDATANDGSTAPFTANGLVFAREGGGFVVKGPSFQLAAWSGASSGGFQNLESSKASGLGLPTVIEAPASGGQGPLYYVIGTTVSTRSARQSSGAAVGANWTASTGTVPIVDYLLYAGNRVWGANGLAAADKSSVYWSELGDPRNWPAANVTKFAPEDGQNITGIGTVGPYVVVFKATKAWVIYDLDTSANRPLGFDVGHDSASTPVETTIGLVFHDPRKGVFVTDGNSVERIDSVLGDLFFSDSNVQQITARDESIFLVGAHPVSGSAIWEYHYPSRTWWMHLTNESSGNSSLLAQKGSGGQSDLITIGRGTAYDIFMASDGLEDSAGGNDLTPYWTTPYLNWGNEMQKRIRHLQLRGKGTLTLTGTKDYVGTSLFMRGPTTIADGGRLDAATLGMARSLQVKIAGSGTTAADKFRLDELMLYADGRRD